MYVLHVSGRSRTPPLVATELFCSLHHTECIPQSWIQSHTSGMCSPGNPRCTKGRPPWDTGHRTIQLPASLHGSLNPPRSCFRFRYHHRALSTPMCSVRNTGFQCIACQRAQSNLSRSCFLSGTCCTQCRRRETSHCNPRSNFGQGIWGMLGR